MAEGSDVEGGRQEHEIQTRTDAVPIAAAGPSLEMSLTQCACRGCSNSCCCEAHHKALPGQAG